MSHKKIKHIDAGKTSSVNDLVEQMSHAGFGAKRLGASVDILEEMIRDKGCKKFIGLAGALVPAGMKKLINDMIDNNWVDVIVTTGANATHDLVEAFGGEHLQGSEKEDDKKLFDRKIDRIYDVFMPNKVYENLEDNLKMIFGELPKKEMSSREFLYEIGKRIKDKESFLKKAADRNIPVFCPAIADSGIGLQVWSYAHKRQISVNTFLDLNEIIDIAWTSKKNGVFILGGGVPKNFILQSMQFSPKTHKYAVQITMDRAEPGGLSGATLEEGISWGKIGKDSRYVDVIADVTIALPFIVSALKARLSHSPLKI